jgi:hypothetical protein
VRWLIPALGIAFLFCPATSTRAAEPLHRRVDALIRAAAKGKPFSPPADDAEFLRRVSLDFAGGIPSAAEARRFLADTAPDRREKLLDRLLAGPEYPVRMQELFGVMLMERLGEHPQWVKYLHDSFAQNKPWDQMAREMLMAATDDRAAGAGFFLSKRLENYGENPVDYPALTRDIGRLFLGKDLRCAQCHDHLFIDDYKQRDFQGLFAFVKNVALQRGDRPAVAEKLTTAKVEFASVFGGDKMATGPRLPGLPEVAVPVLPKGQEYREPPDKKKQTPGVPKFSTLAILAEQLPTPGNAAFNRNIVNRLWFILMGRGLVHPLDLDHGKNPPSHPELLDLLAREFVAHKYDIKWLLRELALTETYQRSGRLPAGETEVRPEEFRTALERRLEVEQLLRAVLEATGENAVQGGATFAALRPAFVKAFAYPAREPEDEFTPTLKATLFVLNDKAVLGWLDPKPGNLTDRLANLDDGKVAEELYLRVLTRRPTAAEAAEVARYLGERRDRRATALRNLTWALIASTEFCVNH